MQFSGNITLSTFSGNQYTIEEMFESIVNNTIWTKLPVNKPSDVLKILQHIVKHSHRPYVDMYNFLMGDYTQILGCQAYIYPEDHHYLEAGITLSNISYIVKMFMRYSGNRFVIGTLGQKVQLRKYWENHVHTGIG